MVFYRIRSTAFEVRASPLKRNNDAVVIGIQHGAECIENLNWLTIVTNTMSVRNSHQGGASIKSFVDPQQLRETVLFVMMLIQCF